MRAFRSPLFGHVGGTTRLLAFAAMVAIALLGLVVPASASSMGSDPGSLTRVGNTLFYSAQGPGGRELWKSDGTDAGTVRVKDINPGPHGSAPHYLTNVGGTLYFRAFDGIDWGLWISDGTKTGTKIVDYIDADELTSFKGMVFFRGTGGLWRSDGTTLGTVLVKDVASGCCFRSITELEAVGDTLFFSAVPAENGANDQLWKSDGTAQGTELVMKIAHIEDTRGIHTLTRAGNSLFFLRDTKAEHSDVFSSYWSDLWTSDGTGSGTKRVKDFVPGEADDVSNLISAQNRAFFQVGQELWKSNGTGAGTVMVYDFAPDGPSSGHPMTNVADRVYLVAGESLWRSNGTSDGTQVVANVTPYQQPLCISNPHGPSSCPPIRNFDPVALADRLIFPSEEGSDGIELWKSNGTAEGTEQLKDIRPGTEGSRPIDLTRVGDLVFFSANDGTDGRELWVTDGTELGTTLISP